MMKIEKIWAQIENILNVALMTVGSMILKLRPKWMLRIAHSIKQFLINLKQSLLNRVVNSKNKTKKRINYYKSNIQKSAKNLNSKLDALLKFIKHIKPKDIKDAFLKFSKNIWTAPFLKFKTAPLYKSFGSFVAVGFVMWGVYSLHYSKSLYSSKTKIDRKIASVVEVDPSLAYKKPKYYLKRLRTLPLTNVQLPILIEGTDFYKSTNADFSVVGSNKNIALFLDEKDELYRDHLMLNVKQIHPDFTLTKEGKAIIEDKILEETNIFLNKYDVTGKVEEVNITNILSNP